MTFLVIAFVQSGCEKKDAHHDNQSETHYTDHDHKHTAPHGGTLVVLGEEFAHIEFALDEASGKLTGYVLGNEAEKPVRLSQGEIKLKIDRLKPGETVTVQLRAVANVLTGETESDTSQYEGQSDALKGVTEFHAQIASIAVKGQRFTDIGFEFPDGNEGERGDHHKH